jgi:hypothetical protein
MIDQGDFLVAELGPAPEPEEKKRRGAKGQAPTEEAAPGEGCLVKKPEFRLEDVPESSPCSWCGTTQAGFLWKVMGAGTLCDKCLSISGGPKGMLDSMGQNYQNYHGLKIQSAVK